MVAKQDLWEHCQFLVSAWSPLNTYEKLHGGQSFSKEKNLHKPYIFTKKYKPYNLNFFNRKKLYYFQAKTRKKTVQFSKKKNKIKYLHNIFLS